MRYFVRLSYCGAPFHGWQSQPNAVSVQQRLEEALQTVLRHPVSLTGAGRTDTGVNARVMFAHFDSDTISSDKRTLIRSVNLLAGHDIAVQDIFPVADNAHARFDATSRTYKYFVTFRKTPFFHHLCWLSPSTLDIDAMNEAAAILTKVDDFTSFAKLHSDTRTNICDVTHARWETMPEISGLDNDTIVFTITANRFLRNMVRAVVGTLVDVGRGKLSINGFSDIIQARDRCAASTSMPPEALYLWDITYPYPLK